MDSFKIEASAKNVIFITLIIFGLFSLWYLRGLVFMVFIAFIFSATLRPLIQKLEDSYKIHRVVSVLLIYIVLIVLFIYVFSNIIGQTYTQFRLLIDDLPGIISGLTRQLNSTFPWLESIFHTSSEEAVRQALIDYRDQLLDQGLRGILGVVKSAVNFALSVVTVMVLAAYMMQRKDSVNKSIINLLDEELQENLHNLFDKIENKLGAWLRAQLLLMVFIGFATWIALILPKFFIQGYNLDKFALPLAVIAGLLEAVPNLGPVLTTGITLIIAAGFSPAIVVVYVLAAFTLIQQLENNVLVPVVMRKAVGIDPIVTVVGILASFQIFGVIGALLIVPMIAVAQIIIEHNLARSRLES